MTDELNKNSENKECPLCYGIMTPWDKNYVCDVCGFGKNSKNEFRTIQKILRYRNKYHQRGLCK